MMCASSGSIRACAERKGKSFSGIRSVIPGLLIVFGAVAASGLWHRCIELRMTQAELVSAICNRTVGPLIHNEFRGGITSTR
jgi:hypothetical protein